MSYSVMREFRSRFVTPGTDGHRPWSDIIAHMPHLYHTAAEREKPTVIELGVRGGNSTCAFLAGIAANQGELYSCDIAAPQVPAEWHSLPQWHFVLGDDISPNVLEWMPAEADVIFIDTSHTYVQTTRELEAYLPRLKSGGVMLLHDTEMEDPLADRPTGDVARALDDYCARAGRNWSNRPGCYGLGVING